MKRTLWETSGHWDHYKDNMYTTVIDGEDFAIKPMNCPGSILVYELEPHSYRDLPLRYGELGLSLIHICKYADEHQQVQGRRFHAVPCHTDAHDRENAKARACLLYTS